MLESIEIRKVENGFVVVVNTEDSTKEHVFTRLSQVIKFLKDQVSAE